MEQFIANFSLMIRFTLRISQRKPEVNFNVNYNVLLVLGERNRLIRTHTNKKLVLVQMHPVTAVPDAQLPWEILMRGFGTTNTPINTKQSGGSGNALVLLLIPMSTIP